MSDRRVERFTRKIEEQEETKEEEDMTTLCSVIDKTGMYKYITSPVQSCLFGLLKPENRKSN